MSDLALNEYGTPVTVMVCTSCGHEFTVCPALPKGREVELWGTECLGDLCPSYDITRDIGIFFEPAAEVGLIRRQETRSNG